ncbi:hypothetical protein HYALB_00011392 [Hymenoscyphus albidus]|uniref:Uncharacterized protein n=1 Tax=Hymenoscyphus albidus TaxID=595503 RepID=A0A9N9LEK5_9HELO|nr:hypothetical protein HYALB_00011392 [Hymenoscyphus albidus]
MATMNVSLALSSNRVSDELSPLRPMKNQCTREYIETYHRHMPKDTPVQEWESRYALYAL